MTKYTAKLIGEFRIPAKQIAPGITRPAHYHIEVIPLEFFARSLEEAERLVEARLSSQRTHYRTYWTWEARGLKAVLPPAIEGLKPLLRAYLKCSDAPRYNREAVDKEIAKEKTITALEARLIHGMLKGRQVRDQ